MRFGLTTPIVTLVPRSHAPWETDAGPAELRQIVQAADRLGYHHVSCSEHVGIPTEVAKVRGGRYYDPAATLGFFAGMTERVRLPRRRAALHHPLAVAGVRDARPTVGRTRHPQRQRRQLAQGSTCSASLRRTGPQYDDALRALRAS
jgi:hypothetical protein